jgi:hypothetical protein
LKWLVTPLLDLKRNLIDACQTFIGLWCLPDLAAVAFIQYSLDTKYRIAIYPTDIPGLSGSASYEPFGCEPAENSRIEFD